MTAHKMVPVGLIEALQRQRQVDEDGTECGVNREAVDSAIGILQAIAAAPAPDVNPIDDPRLQEMFSAAIDGAHAYGYMGKNQPTGGHWLAKFWGLGRQHREAVDDSRKESAPAPDVCEVPRELLSQLREDAIGYAELIDDVRMHRPVLLSDDPRHGKEFTAQITERITQADAILEGDENGMPEL